MPHNVQVFTVNLVYGGKKLTVSFMGEVFKCGNFVPWPIHSPSGDCPPLGSAYFEIDLCRALESKGNRIKLLSLDFFSIFVYTGE